MIKALGSKHPGALVNAVQPLIVCKFILPHVIFTTHYSGGRTLKDMDEQLELLELLRKIEQNTAWSTEQGIQSLQEAWRLQLI
jgi:hypothetical protein